MREDRQTVGTDRMFGFSRMAHRRMRCGRRSRNYEIPVRRQADLKGRWVRFGGRRTHRISAQSSNFYTSFLWAIWSPKSIKKVPNTFRSYIMPSQTSLVSFSRRVHCAVAPASASRRGRSSASVARVVILNFPFEAALWASQRRCMTDVIHGLKLQYWLFHTLPFICIYHENILAIFLYFRTHGHETPCTNMFRCVVHVKSSA